MQNAVEIPENVIVPESKHTVTALLEEIFPPCVGGALGVLSTINFDNQHSFSANEVGVEWSDYFLANELASMKLTTTKTLPKHHFGLCRVSPKSS